MHLLKRDSIQKKKDAKDWKDAIRIAAMPLEEAGYVEERYKEEMIANVETIGPYFVMAPYIALPHGRPEQGVIDTQIGVTLFDEDVFFDQKDVPVRLFITLAAKDSNSHLEVMAKILKILQDQEVTDKILKAQDEDELAEYFNI